MTSGPEEIEEEGGAEDESGEDSGEDVEARYADVVVVVVFGVSVERLDAFLFVDVICTSVSNDCRETRDGEIARTYLTALRFRGIPIRP